MIIYHITKKAEIKKILEGEGYSGDTLQSEGFIHCSTLDQVIGVANQRFKGQADLVLLCIETDLVKPEIRYENLEGGNSIFPHIYGTLNKNAICNLVDLSPGDDGNFMLPKEMSGL